jgi:hypothetical protein
MDETYVGGKPRKTNAILNDKGNVIKERKIVVKRGRGTGKMAVAGIKKRSTTKVYANHMPYNNKKERLTGTQLLSVIKKICKKGTIVMIDEYGGYEILNKKDRKKYTAMKLYVIQMVSIIEKVDFIQTE